MLSVCDCIFLVVAFIFRLSMLQPSICGALFCVINPAVLYDIPMTRNSQLYDAEYVVFMSSRYDLSFTFSVEIIKIFRFVLYSIC